MDKEKELARLYLGNLVDSAELACLFVNDLEVGYYCSLSVDFCGKSNDNHEISYNFTHLHKCVLMTYKYPELDDYLEEYLKTCSTINAQCSRGYSALHLACCGNANYPVSNFRTVQILVNAGIDINLQDFIGNTALHMTITICRASNVFNVVELLINSNAKINLQNIYGWTSLHIASFYSYKSIYCKITRMLIMTGADLNLQTYEHRVSALHLVSLRLCDFRKSNDNLEKVAKMLIDAGININMQDADGCTSLHTACIFKVDNFIVMLLNANSDYTLINNRGHSLEDYFNCNKNYYLQMKARSKLPELSVDECTICYEKTCYFNCKFAHYICKDCVLKVDTIKCLICKTLY